LILLPIKIHITIFLIELRLLLLLLFHLLPVRILPVVIANIVVYLVVNALHYHSFLLCIHCLRISASVSACLAALHLDVAYVPLLFAISEESS